MRIIHTADWHIGQTLAGYGRESEHRAVLARLATLAAEREADALIVAGDVFDHQNPSGDAQRLYYEALVALRQARPAMTIVVTAGNHDAAGRLEAPQALLSAMDVRVVGNVRRSGPAVDAARHLIPLRDPHGEIAAEVLAVSHPTPACLPPFASTGAAGGLYPVAEATRQLYAQLMEGSGAGRHGVPLVVTGHLHVAGAIESEGAERRILVGGQHAVPPSIFPESAAYVALGHLHKAQAVGRPGVRYSGSLLPLSASEHAYDHGVTLLTLDNGAAAIEHIAIARPVAFVRLPRTGYVPLSELGDRLAALDLPGDLPPERQPFVQINLARQGITAAWRAEADQIAARFAVRVVDIRLAAAEAAAAPTIEAPVARLAEMAPEDLFHQAFERAHGKAPETAHRDAFHRAAAHAAET